MKFLNPILLVSMLLGSPRRLVNVGESLFPPSLVFPPLVREGPGVRRHRPSGSIAQLNRHTGEPHEHKREIARRRRQAAAAGRT